MKEFVDLEGASGATYRFRAVREGQEPLRIAGNHAWLRWRDDRFTVVLVGVTNDLSTLRQSPRPEGTRGAKLFVRLNVARAMREAEHRDLDARYGRGQAGVGDPAGSSI